MFSDCAIILFVSVQHLQAHDGVQNVPGLTRVDHRSVQFGQKKIVCCNIRIYDLVPTFIYHHFEARRVCVLKLICFFDSKV